MSNEIARRIAELKHQEGINNVRNLRMNGVSETTIQAEQAQNEIEYIKALAEMGSISKSEAQRRIAEIDHQRGINNVNNMTMHGVSEYSINKERINNEMRYLQAMQEYQNMRDTA